MTTKIQQWGNSLALRLPKDVAKKFKLRKGSSVVIAQDTNKILIKPLYKTKTNLKELVSKITPKNIHDEFDWGKPVGKEIW
jgi:antitoxin MazE